MNDETGLPASIEAAWGLRERPRKGPKRELSLDRIVETAVQMATSAGLEAVSMSRVAADLDVSTMSLYRYVAAKGELLALMVDTAYGAPPAASTSDEGWREGLARWAWAERAAFRRHPWLVRIPISGPPTTPNAVAWLENGLGQLRGTGLTEGEKMSVMLLFTGFVRFSATLAADLDAAFQASGSSVQEAMPSYGRLLTKLTDARRYPALHAVIASGVFDEPDDPDAEFVFGLERMLDGIDVLVKAHRERIP